MGRSMRQVGQDPTLTLTIIQQADRVVHHRTPLSELQSRIIDLTSCPLVAAGTTLQALPFQCRVRGRSPSG